MSTRRCAALALAFLLNACADELPTGAPPGAQQSPTDLLTARVGDLDQYVSIFIDARQGGGLMYLSATAWPRNDDTRHYLTLSFETTVGSAVQTIGPGHRVSATLAIEYEGGWIANDSLGSGTVTLTSLTADRAIGTFSFVGEASGAVTPPLLQVKDGRFDVRLK